jgi:small subunit ribosomal protein S18
MLKKKMKKTSPSETKTCFFCDTKTTPNYKEVENLDRFVTTRGKIVGKKRSGLCARHQRRLAQEVKRARHLGLITFE